MLYPSIIFWYFVYLVFGYFWYTFLNRYTLEDHSELKIGDDLCSGSKLNLKPFSPKASSTCKQTKRCCLQPQLAVVPKNEFVYTRDMWSSMALNAKTSHLDSVLQSLAVETADTSLEGSRHLSQRCHSYHHTRCTARLLLRCGVNNTQVTNLFTNKQ